MDARYEFLALLLSLVEFFAADTAAVSVNTTRFGTITRADAVRLLPQAQAAVEGR